MGVIGILFSLGIWIFKGLDHLSFLNVIIAILTGTFYVVGNLFYFKAVKIGEISRLIPIYHLAPIFVLVFAAIFLGEIFTPLKYLGIFLLVGGAALISTKNLKVIKLEKSFWLMISSVLFLSIYLIITKYLLNFADFWTIFSYIRFGMIIPLIPMFYLHFKDLKSTVKKHGAKSVWVMSLAETLNIVAALLYTIAASVGFITLVESLASTQSFFVLLFTIILSIHHPRILKEEIGRKVILTKIVAIAIMFVGVLLII